MSTTVSHDLAAGGACCSPPLLFYTWNGSGIVVLDDYGVPANLTDTDYTSTYDPKVGSNWGANADAPERRRPIGQSIDQLCVFHNTVYARNGFVFAKHGSLPERWKNPRMEEIDVSDTSDEFSGYQYQRHSWWEFMLGNTIRNYLSIVGKGVSGYVDTGAAAAVDVMNLVWGTDNAGYCNYGRMGRGTPAQDWWQFNLGNGYRTGAGTWYAIGASWAGLGSMASGSFGHSFGGPPTIDSHKSSIYRDVAGYPTFGSGYGVKIYAFPMGVQNIANTLRQQFGWWGSSSESAARIAAKSVDGSYPFYLYFSWKAPSTSENMKTYYDAAYELGPITATEGFCSLSSVLDLSPPSTNQPTFFVGPRKDTVVTVGTYGTLEDTLAEDDVATAGTYNCLYPVVDNNGISGDVKMRFGVDDLMCRPGGA